MERGEVAPAAKPFETQRQNPELKDWIWAVVEVDLSRLTDKAERASRSVSLWE